MKSQDLFIVDRGVDIEAIRPGLSKCAYLSTTDGGVGVVPYLEAFRNPNDCSTEPATPSGHP